MNNDHHSDPIWGTLFAYVAVPGANFYLTHPFLDLVSGRSSNWHSAHARVGGVQPLNPEANLEMALFGVSNFERRF